MRVHIVVPEHRSDWILARLARYLTTWNKWTAGKKPRREAHLNIFIPYLEWRFTKWKQTPTAGWMTHYEPGDKCRRKAWELAARKLTLRVTPCRQYAKLLASSGLTAHIPHPVELKKFVLKGRPRNSRPTIGVSGVVYPGGRKGEHLVKRLYKEHGKQWHIKASGRGWPIKCRWYPWARLQEFYHGLDIFLCTSLIEGGPVTMLEALACGRPIVVPRGVGQVDDLPIGPGIYRYKAGDYSGMVLAIHRALTEKPEPEIMRRYVKPYPVKAWAKHWRIAAERLCG